MGRMACTEPQCLYKGALYLFSMCFVWLSEQTVTFALYIITRFVFMTEVESIYCAVRTESLCNTVLSLKGELRMSLLGMGFTRTG